MRKTAKAAKRDKCAAPKIEKRYIVEWVCADGKHTRKFPSLLKANRYAKEWRRLAKRYIDDRADYDGNIATGLATLKVYEAAIKAA